MKRGFVVCGPEGSGTRVVTRWLMGAGAFGDDGHVQRMDNLVFAGRPATIVLRRSVPHGGQWPGLGGIALEMAKAGYSVTAVVCVRELYALARSQVRAGHVKSVGEAERNIERAYRHIWQQWGERKGVRVVTVSYEANVLHRGRGLALMLESLGLAAPPQSPPYGSQGGGKAPEWYDGNLRYYFDPGMGRLGFSGAVLEVLGRAGYWTMEDLAGASDEELLGVAGIGRERLRQIREAAGGEGKNSGRAG